MASVDPHDFVTALRRIEGQARGVQKMIEAGRPCDEVIQQLGAMRAAIDRLGPRFIAANLRACLAGAGLPRGKEAGVEQGLAALADLRR
jgi:CsoR family transcriptional regulator, copper-sensing transcriptional repressor